MKDHLCPAAILIAVIALLALLVALLHASTHGPAPDPADGSPTPHAPAFQFP